MDISIKKLPSMSIAGINVKAHWSELGQIMPEVWRKWFQYRSSNKQNRLQLENLELSLGAQDGIYSEIIGAQLIGNGPVPAPDGLTQYTLPPARYVHCQHLGPLSSIAESFGQLIQWCENNHLQPTGIKLDIGYTDTGKEPSHELYVQVRDALRI